MHISIIGNHGDLATALYKKLVITNSVTCYGKEKFNYTNKEDINTLANFIHQSDIIINCPGVFSENDSWDMFSINAIAPISLLEKLVEKHSKAHVILIGSHGAMWTSWPGISFERLSYNISKETIQSFVTGLAQSGLTKLKLSMINPSRFQSKLNNYQGYPIDIIVDGIIHVITAPTPILLYEYNSYQDVN